MASVQIALRREPGTEDLPLPQYATAGAAGMDLVAAVPMDRPVTLLPGQRALIPTGLRIAVPAGYEAQIRPRSGLALKYGIGMANSPGTIDSDYRGPVGVLLVHFGEAPFVISRGDRIAQMVIAPVVQAVWAEVEIIGRDKARRGRFWQHRRSRRGRFWQR